LDDVAQILEYLAGHPGQPPDVPASGRGSKPSIMRIPPVPRSTERALFRNLFSLVEHDSAGPHPLEAMEKVFLDHQFDEIIVATLPRRVSRWLRADLPRQAERRFGLPITTIITKR
jgi:hypothetical protein